MFTRINLKFVFTFVLSIMLLALIFFIGYFVIKGFSQVFGVEL